MFRKRKYQTRIYAWITTVMVFLTTLFSTVVYLKVENTVFSNEYDTNQKILNQMKFNIDYMDEMVKNVCLSSYYNDDVKSLMNLTDDETFEQMSIINKLSNSVVASNSYIHSIDIYNNRKKVFYSTYNNFKYEDPDLVKLIHSYANVPVLKPILRKMETYRSGDFIKYDYVLTYFMYEMTDNYNNMNGAVIVNVKLDWLVNNIKAINSLDSKRQDEIFILDGKGEFILDAVNSRPEKNELEKYITDLYSKSIKNSAIKGTYLNTGNINGRNYILSCIPIQNIDWVLIKVQPCDIVFDYINKLKNTIIIITIILLILIFIAAYTLARGFYKPFEGLLRMVGFNSDTLAGAQKNSDEFIYLKEVYKNSIDQLRKYSMEKRSNEKIIKLYFLRKLLLQSFSITSREFETNKSEHGIALSLDKPFLIILLVIDRHKEFEAENDIETRELLKFAVINITSEILSRNFQNEAVEMKNDEIAFIVNIGDDTADVYDLLNTMLKEAQKNIFEYYKLSFTAVLSEKTDKAVELTAVYNRVSGNSVYRFVFGHMTVISPEMTKKNLTAAQHYFNDEIHKKLIEEIKHGDLKAAELRLAGLLKDVRNLEYNNMMLSLAYLVNTIKNTVYEMNQTRKEPVNVNVILSNNEIFELETMDEFHEILSKALQRIIIPVDAPNGTRDLKIAESIKRLISENYSDYNLSASGIAQQLRMSPAKISKVFKENVNMSIPEYINNIRLAKAVEWMVNSKLSVGEIMLKVGIENESYFYKIFKAKYGTTPRDYIVRGALK